MAKVLVLVTKSATLGLLDGRRHPSGFWAEEFVLPYELIRAEGYEVEVATVGGVVPVPDSDSLDPGVVRYTRPAGAPGGAEDDVAHYRAVLDSAAPTMITPLRSFTDPKPPGHPRMPGQ